MQDKGPWHFGLFEADAREHRLRRAGQVVPLTRKSFSLLATLLSRPGHLFTKAELFDTVWSGRVVTEAALSRAVHELRVALDDDAGSPRYIATAHGLGFRFVAPVSGEPRSAPIAGHAGLQGHPLVAREDELARLGVALVEACAGKRQVVFVTGEAGIGKTALVEAFVGRETGRTDVWVAQGRCIEQYGPGEAFLPIFEVLEQLSRQVGAEVFRELLARYAPAWLAQLPWLARPGTPPAGLEPIADSTPQRMLREIAQALEVLAASKPVVIWLEDLHWSDPSSLAVVSFLAGRRDPARLLVVGSYRPSDARAAAMPLHGLVLRLTQRGQACELALAALDERAIKQYLEMRLGTSAQRFVDELGAFVHRRTEGNALFTVTMLDDLIRRRELTSANGAWTLKASVAALGNDLPESLRHLIHEQHDRLPEADRRLLEAAAVAGTDFSAVTVAAALQSDPAQVEERCAWFAQQGRFIRTQAAAVWPDGTVAAGFGFLHALYSQGIQERVPHGRRIEWQRRIGLRQEQGYGAHRALVAAELAMRFEAARDLPRNLLYLQIAGASALARCAYPEGITLLRRALERVADLPAEQRARQELDLLLPLGAALMASKGYADDEVDATYRRARTLCQDTGAGPGDLERVLRGQWNVAFIRADLAGARQIAAQLLEQAEAGADGALVLDAHTKLGQTCLHLGELAAARLHLEHALALSVATDGSPPERGAPRVAINLAWALWFGGHPAAALHWVEQALILSHDAASPHSTAFALGYGMYVHFLRGDTTRAHELAPQLNSLTTLHGLVYWRQLGSFMDGMFTARRGDPARGSRIMRAAMEEMRTSGAKVGIPYLLCLLAEASLECGQVGDARAALDDADRLVTVSGNALYGAEVIRLEGEVALIEGGDTHSRRLAEQRFEAAIELAIAQGNRAIELRAATSLAELLVAQGRPQRAVGVLAPVLARFVDGSETADGLRARRLLDELGT